HAFLGQRPRVRRGHRAPHRSVDREDSLERLPLVGRAPVREGASADQGSGEARPVARLQRGELLSEEGEAVRLLPAVDDEEGGEVPPDDPLLEKEDVGADVALRLPVDRIVDLLVVEDEVDEYMLPGLRRPAPREGGGRAEERNCENRAGY